MTDAVTTGTAPVVRYQGNPIIGPEDVSPAINAVMNPGATAFEGGTLLLLRVEDRTGLSRLVVATSRDGLTDWQIDPGRGLSPDPDRFEERWGAEDPRITEIDGVYHIVYTGYSAGGPLVCLALTRDFVTFERQGVLMPPEDKDAALFPQKFDDRWALIHRPAPATSGFGANIWLSWSPDLHYWGDGRMLLASRRGGWWDANKVGLGPPPMRTERGWLMCYHGVRVTGSGSIYRAGLALLDLAEPQVVLARTDEWVFGPQAPYERIGDVPNVVFPSGWVLDEDGDTIRIYYGAADNVVGAAMASLGSLLQLLEASPGAGMNVEVFADPRAVTTAAVEAVVESAARAIDAAGRFLVALSGGSTPRAVFQQLAAPGYADRIEWEAVHVFWGDERCVSPSDPSSNYAMATETLLNHVAVKPGHVHRIRGEDDPESAAGAYERLLRRAFSTPEGPPGHDIGSRFDLVMLGMGEDGHTASLFPRTPAVAETQRWVMPTESPLAPRRRVTLTPPLINAAAEKLFLVTGQAKAPALARVLRDPKDPDILPAQAVEDARWLVDADAASRLEG